VLYLPVPAPAMRARQPRNFDDAFLRYPLDDLDH
jgi:hypothetical protein